MPRQLFIVFPLLFPIVAIVYDANANENTATGAETQTEAEKLENEYDEDDLGGADYAVEEIIFGSPQDIEDMTNQALKEFAYKIRKEEGLKGPGGYGTILTHFQDLGLCMKLNIDTMQIANVAFQRLKNVLVQIPIALPQRRPLSLNVRQGDDPKELVESFCELYGIPEENVPAILTPVLRGLYPEAIVVPFDPNKNYTTADVNAALGAASK
eukprot:Stramenopile-MAST_4_protein_247